VTTPPADVADGGSDHPGAAVAALYELTHLLRRECPWDQAQTAGTIVPHTLEEAYEVADVVAHVEHALAEDPAATSCLRDLEDELGDLLFQVCFLAMWCEELDASINLDSVAAAIHRKLIRRHPHVFGVHDAASDADDVRGRWEAVKRDREQRGLFEGIPAAMPAVGQARKMQQRAGSVGFDFGSAGAALSKVAEELDELTQAIESVSSSRVVSASEQLPPDPHIESEVGDLLFAVVNVARLARVDPELALRGANSRFRSRVTGAVERAAAAGYDFASLELSQQEAWYQRSKADLEDLG
jgi:ATP diphosphatase